ncbi:MAG: malectin [Acidobacteriia bacterium]|nr:malectin [Terriglobia bacterium]
MRLAVALFSGGVVLLSGQTSGAAFTPIRINAGGPAYTDSHGTAWSADAGFGSGSTYGTVNPIANTADPSLYQTSRWGVFTYQFAVPNGDYSVNLKFAELYFTAPGYRSFNVAINGAPVLTDFDIVAQAGGGRVALDKSFPVTVANGQIAIAFTAGAENWPNVNGVEIVASSSPTPAPSPTPTVPSGFTPVRVNAGGQSYTDPNGTVWAADNGSTGGNLYPVIAPIAGTAAQPLYQASRWGVFDYVFAVPNGSYLVNLKFAELQMSYPGTRQFNVAINGVTAVSNFDIFAQAGGALRALDKSFPVTVTNGKMDIAFTAGAAGWPTVNGVEIVAAQPLVRVNAGGGGYTDPTGAYWTADSGYNGGNSYAVGYPVSGTAAQALYQTSRWGVFGYAFSVPNGPYMVSLLFAEPFANRRGARIFNVSINGAPALTNFDIYAAAGFMSALRESFPVNVTNGQVQIAFTAGAENWPTVNGIHEIKHCAGQRVHVYR